MFVSMLVVTLVCGWRVNRARNNLKVIQELRDDGFIVLNEGDVKANAYPQWLVNFVGPEYFETITYVERWHGKPIEAKRVREIAKLGTVKRLRVSIRDISEKHFVALGK